jgi:hypothetical protein
MTDGCSAIKILQKQSLSQKKKNLMGVVPSFRNKRVWNLFWDKIMKKKGEKKKEKKRKEGW